MTALVISIIIAIIGMAILFYGLMDSEPEISASGLVILIMDGLLGFGLACSCSCATATEVQTNKFSFAKTESVLTIQTPEKTETFSDAHTFNSISDSSKVFIHVNYNVYGGEVSSNLIVK